MESSEVVDASISGKQRNYGCEAIRHHKEPRDGASMEVHDKARSLLVRKLGS